MTTSTKNFRSRFDIINPNFKPLVNTALIATGLALGAVFAPWERALIM